MSIKVANVIDISTIKLKVQKLTTTGDFVAGSIPIFPASSAGFSWESTSTKSNLHIYLFVNQPLTERNVGVYDKTLSLFVWYQFSGDFYVNSTALGYINITTLRSDVTSLQSPPTSTVTILANSSYIIPKGFYEIVFYGATGYLQISFDGGSTFTSVSNISGSIIQAVIQSDGTNYQVYNNDTVSGTLQLKKMS